MSMIIGAIIISAFVGAYIGSVLRAYRQSTAEHTQSKGIRMLKHQEYNPTWHKVMQWTGY